MQRTSVVARSVVEGCTVFIQQLKYVVPSEMCGSGFFSKWEATLSSKVRIAVIPEPFDLPYVPG